MSHFLSPFREALSAPASRVREYFSKRAGALPGYDAVSGDHCTRAEQLEHIAMYARAGYFNLGYTVDAFHSPVEASPQ